MKYDFTTVLDRHGKDAAAADGSPYPGVQTRDGLSRIPMWVADMNFATVPTVQEAIISRVQHPTFGYFGVRDEYYDAILRWQRVRNGVTDLSRSDVGYDNGVLGGVVSAVNVMCSRGDAVLVHTPLYCGYTGSLGRVGYKLVESPLRRDAAGVWRMDFADMEKKIADNRIHAAVICSPHNPCGRVWERWELERAMELFRKYDVYVVSDEIWSDLILPGHKHVPTQSVSEDARRRTVALYAVTKTFNLAGLVGSYRIVYDRWLRERVDREASVSHYDNMNVLSMHALIGAYRPEGEQWTDELCAVLGENTAWACDYIGAHFPGVSVARPEGTYMLFLDCSQWLRSRGKTLDELLRAGAEAGVIWQDGRPFGAADSIRMNLALPTKLVQEAFGRLDRYVFGA